MSEVFDLNAVEAETRDDKPPFKFRFGVEEFTLPNYVDQRVWAMDANGDTAKALAIALGKEQFVRLGAQDAVFDTKRMTSLINAWVKHIGESLGESVASTGSSKSTARPSKQTSKGSTKSGSRTSSSRTKASPGGVSAS